MARLKEIYKKEIAPALSQQFGYSSPMQVPRISKIVLNMGVGEAVADKKILDNAVGDMQKISGQKPVVTKAKKSIAIWKIRTGYPIGCMVTLRQDRMYEFLDRLVSIALPRVRDFRGVSARSFDGRGNFSLGVKEQIIFPEIEYDKIDAAGDRSPAWRRASRSTSLTPSGPKRKSSPSRAMRNRRCSPRSSSHSRTKGHHGQNVCGQPRPEAPPNCEEVREKARRAARDHRQSEDLR